MRFHQMLENHAKALEAAYVPPAYDGPPPIDPQQVQGWLDMLDRWAKAPKAKAVDPNDDPAFSAKVSHVLKRGERLMEFVARTGLGRAQALTMNREEISRFVEIAERNSSDEVGPPSAHKFLFGPQPRPSAPMVMVG